MEGPSVHQAAKRIGLLEGQTIEAVYGNARQPIAQLRGERIQEVRAVRKRLFVDTTGMSVVTHFLMYGSYRINKRREKPERIGLKCTNDTVNIYNGSVKVLDRNSEEYKEYDRPDRDVLSDRFDRDYALRAMRGEDRIIADVLLDQDIFGGVGKIIKNEVLYMTGIDPRSVASSIPRVKAEELVENIIEFTGEWLEAKLNGQKVARVMYNQTQCECDNKIVREDMGEYNRRTFYCMSCQTLYE
ncbi:hypothetical protein EU545_04115 [Candidatus Thorarchaeota archaeon]|nr:MAG: hypothetical protein EU545_04115 [Candidatus Thorarchaeota archaeon]